MVHLLIDVLDEYIKGLNDLLELITRTLSSIICVKQIVSSRNQPAIEERLRSAYNQLLLSLELNAQSILEAINTFVDYKVRKLTIKKKYNNKIKADVLNYLSINANGTFLQVALVY